MTSFGQWRAAGGAGHLSEDLSVPEPARAFQGERAGFTSRFIAAVIDVSLVALLMIGVWFTLVIVQAIFTPGVNIDAPTMGTLILWGYIFTTLYWMFAWANTGRSLGGWVMGVRVVSPRGHRLGFFYALLRSGFCVAFPFGLLWALVSKRNRSVQDLVLRTNVIYDWALRPPSLLSSDSPK